MLDRSEQKGAELAALGIGDRQVVLGQQPNEEFLGQVLRVLSRKAGSPHEGVERKPVILAKRGQGTTGLGDVAHSGPAALPGGTDDHAPVRRREAVAMRRQSHLFTLVIHIRILGPAGS